MIPPPGFRRQDSTGRIPKQTLLGVARWDHYFCYAPGLEDADLRLTRVERSSGWIAPGVDDLGLGCARVRGCGAPALEGLPWSLSQIRYLGLERTRFHWSGSWSAPGFEDLGLERTSVRRSGSGERQGLRIGGALIAKARFGQVGVGEDLFDISCRMALAFELPPP